MFLRAKVIHPAKHMFLLTVNKAMREKLEVNDDNLDIKWTAEEDDYGKHIKIYIDDDSPRNMCNHKILDEHKDNIHSVRNV